MHIFLCNCRYKVSAKNSTENNKLTLVLTNLSAAHIPLFLC